MNEGYFPTPKNKSTAEFLKDLRDKLEPARSYSDAHAVSAQQRYITRYNKRSHEKSFTIGESVLVLQKDSNSSKVFSKRTGPAIIFEVKSPNSYVVEFEDGSRRILHANHLRKFHTRTQSSTYTASLIASTNSCRAPLFTTAMKSSVKFMCQIWLKEVTKRQNLLVRKLIAIFWLI